MQDDRWFSNLEGGEGLTLTLRGPGALSSLTGRDSRGVRVVAAEFTAEHMPRANHRARRRA